MKQYKNSQTEQHIPISEFKSKCLKLLGETGNNGREYTITKKGEPIARVIPIKKSQGKSLRGAWKGMVEIHGDIVNFNLMDDWEAAKE